MTTNEHAISEKKIKKITGYTLPYALFETERAEEARFKTQEEHFDEHGNQILQVRFDESGEESERIYWSYDDKNRLIEERVVHALSETEERRAFEYDEAGKGMVEINYYGDEPGEKVITKMNDEEEPLEIYQYDEEGELASIHKFGYYKPGLIREEKELDRDENLLKQVRYFYDEKDQLIKQEIESHMEDLPSHTVEVERGEMEETWQSVSDDGKLLLRRIRKYDDKGRLIEYIHEDHLDSYNSRIQELEYDENDRIVKNEFFDLQHNLIRKNEFEYDQKGFLAEEIFFNNNPYTGNQHFKTLYEYETYE